MIDCGDLLTGAKMHLTLIVAIATVFSFVLFNGGPAAASTLEPVEASSLALPNSLDSASPGTGESDKGSSDAFEKVPGRSETGDTAGGPEDPLFSFDSLKLGPVQPFLSE